MCGGVVTAPFDVVKTRLQSSMFQNASSTASNTTGMSVRTGGLLWNFVETGHLLRCVSPRFSPQKQTARVFFLHEYNPYMHSTEKYKSLKAFQRCSEV